MDLEWLNLHMLDWYWIVDMNMDLHSHFDSHFDSNCEHHLIVVLVGIVATVSVVLLR